MAGTWICPFYTDFLTRKVFSINEQVNWPEFYTQFISLNDKNFTIDIEFLLNDISKNQYIFGQDTVDTPFSLVALAKENSNYSTIRLIAKNIITRTNFYCI